MSDTPDEEESGDDRSSDDPPDPDPPDGGTEPPEQEEDARDVIGTALGALRAMIDPAGDTDASNDSPDTGASD